MKFSQILSTTVALSALAFSAGSFAVPQFAVSFLDTSTSASLVVNDNDANDTFGAINGAISATYSTAALEISTALSTITSDPYSLHLNGTLSTLTAAGGEVTIGASVTDLTLGNNWIFGIGGLAGNGADVSAVAYIDYGNALFGAGAEIGSVDFNAITGTFSFDSDQLALAANGPYSLTILTTITHYGQQTTSFDSAVNVPEPSIIALMGLGLVGMGLVTRRKQKAA